MERGVRTTGRVYAYEDRVGAGDRAVLDIALVRRNELIVEQPAGTHGGVGVPGRTDRGQGRRTHDLQGCRSLLPGIHLDGVANVFVECGEGGCAEDDLVWVVESVTGEYGRRDSGVRTRGD